MSLVYAKCRFLPDIFFSKAALVGSYFSHKLCTCSHFEMQIILSYVSVQVKPQYDTYYIKYAMKTTTYIVFQSKFWDSSFVTLMPHDGKGQ